MNRLIG